VPPATPTPPAAASDTLLCARCGSDFQCGASSSGGCWCNEVVLSDAVRSDLASFYKGCLCPACLQTLEDARPPKPSVREFLKKNLKRNR
jgi:hypothetical protein